MLGARSDSDKSKMQKLNSPAASGSDDSLGLHAPYGSASSQESIGQKSSGMSSSLSGSVFDWRKRGGYMAWMRHNYLRLKVPRVVTIENYRLGVFLRMLQFMMFTVIVTEMTFSQKYLRKTPATAVQAVRLKPNDGWAESTQVSDSLCKPGSKHYPELSRTNFECKRLGVEEVLPLQTRDSEAFFPTSFREQRGAGAPDRHVVCDGAENWHMLVEHFFEIRDVFYPMERGHSINASNNLLTLVQTPDSPKTWHTFWPGQVIKLHLSDILRATGVSLHSRNPRVLNDTFYGTSQQPKLWLTGLDIRMSFTYYNKACHIERYHDGPVCYVEMAAAPGWVRWTVTDFEGEMVSVRTRDYHGVRLRLSTQGHFGYFDWSSIVYTGVRGFVLVNLVGELVLLFALHCLGKLSRVYRRALMVHLNVMSHIHGWASRMLCYATAYQWMVGSRTEGLTRTRVRQQISLAVASHTKKNCPDILDENECDQMTELISRGMDRESNGSILMSDFVDMATQNESFTMDTMTKLLEVDKKPGFLTRLFQDNGLTEFVTQFKSVAERAALMKQSSSESFLRDTVMRRSSSGFDDDDDDDAVTRSVSEYGFRKPRYGIPQEHMDKRLSSRSADGPSRSSSDNTHRKPRHSIFSRASAVTKTLSRSSCKSDDSRSSGSSGFRGRLERNASKVRMKFSLYDGISKRKSRMQSKCEQQFSAFQEMRGHMSKEHPFDLPQLLEEISRLYSGDKILDDELKTLRKEAAKIHRESNSLHDLAKKVALKVQRKSSDIVQADSVDNCAGTGESCDVVEPYESKSDMAEISDNGMLVKNSIEMSGIEDSFIGKSASAYIAYKEPIHATELQTSFNESAMAPASGSWASHEEVLLQSTSIVDQASIQRSPKQDNQTLMRVRELCSKYHSPSKGPVQDDAILQSQSKTNSHIRESRPNRRSSAGRIIVSGKERRRKPRKVLRLAAFESSTYVQRRNQTLASRIQEESSGESNETDESSESESESSSE